MIVLKFGGTSVKDATAIRRVCEIVAAKVDRAPVVVASAMAGVTDALINVARRAADRRFSDAAEIIQSLRERHRTTARELIGKNQSGTGELSLENVERGLDALFTDLEGLARSIATLGELTGRSLDAIASFGERMSSIVVAAALHSQGISAHLVDSRSFVITDSHFTNASPKMKETETRTRDLLVPLIDSGSVPVAQGFIGSTPQGVTTTIGRGGSDYSAAIIGAVLGAKAIEIWTDVDGLMTADPRVIKNARRIRVISFSEAAELSFFGAKVLHPSTLLPAIERRIPVHIYNTLNPTCEGTLIVAEPPRSQNAIKSIAFKRGVTVVNVASTRMLQAHGFLRAIFDVFDRNETSVDVVTTSEVSVSMTLDTTDRLDTIKQDLSGIGEVSVDPGKAIVCIVGDNLKFTPGIAARLFKAIDTTNVNMISQGASEINLTFVIDETDAHEVVQRLHEEFFAEVDQKVFA